jgi:hypothetical protein
MAGAGIGQGGAGAGQGEEGRESEQGEAGPHRAGPFEVVPRTSLPSRGGELRYSDPVDLAVALTTFVVIFPAELPDKSLFASLVLGTRFRPLPVFCGVAAAFALHVVIAVTIGGVFALLPQRLVLFVVAALFAVGSVLLLRGREEEETAPRRPGPWPTSAPSASSWPPSASSSWASGETSPRSPPPT